MQNQNFYNPAFSMPGYNAGYNGQIVHHAYGQPLVKAPNNQPITPEDQAYLMTGRHKFDMSIDPDKLLAAKCTHKDVKTGETTISMDSNGNCTCAICGAKWNMYDGTVEGVIAAINNVKNIIESIKSFYADMSPKVIEEMLAPMLCLLDMLYKLWEMAVANFNKYEQMNVPVNTVGMFGGNPFDQYNSVLNYAAQPVAVPQYPQYPVQYPQPVVPQQPMYGQSPFNMSQFGQPTGYAGMNPNMAPADPNAANPMAFVAPAAGVMPNGVPAPAAVMPNANPAPAATDVVQQNKVYQI